MAILKNFAKIAAPLVVLLLLQISTAHATTMQILYSFCTPLCDHGIEPYSSLLPDGSGGFYGTTSTGGPNGGGEVFHLAETAGTWSIDVLYGFCAQPDCAEGDLPQAGVIQDVDGNLYGVTDYKGINNAGTVFELIPNARRTKWRFKLLYKFCTVANCADGITPNGLAYVGQASGVPYDGTSPLYGTTRLGGVNTGGVAFSLTPSGKKWKFKTFHDFCFSSCVDDGSSSSRFIADSAGNLFATTEGGGTNGRGAVIKFAPKRKGKFTESVIYSFCPQQSCADGSDPYAPVIQDAAGNFYGTTVEGGAHNEGSVFKLTPNGNRYDLTTLYSFCSLSECADGLSPLGQLALDFQGNIYGTTEFGGDLDNSGGVVFTLNPAFHVLYTFCSQSTSCKDGENPVEALYVDGQKNVFGLTNNGGAHNAGELFEISP